MSTFRQAVEWLKEGKKVRRKFFAEDRYLFLSTGSVVEIDNMGNYPFKIHDLEADDWEIYKEEKETGFKTLKEFEGLDGIGEPLKDEKDDSAININRLDLKQEAIKEIKFPKLEELFLSGRSDLLPEIKEIIGEGIKSYIKWKFNIIEEDLK